MHVSLSKHPITYVLAQIRFTNIEFIEKYIPEIQDKLRKYFPVFNRININAIQFREDQPAPSLFIKQWHFTDKDSVMGILLDDQSITLHTSKYDCFDKIIKQLEQVLNDINPFLNISLFVRLGVRYINVIQSNFEEYLQPSLLGFRLTENECFDPDRYLSNNRLTQKSTTGIIVVNSTCIGNKESITSEKNFLVPDELAYVAKYLSFMHLKQPTDKFVVLDIDHFHDQKDDFEINKVMDKLAELQHIVYEAFCLSVTPKALADWK